VNWSFEEGFNVVYRGCVHNGVVVFDGDVRLAEGTPVTVESVDVPVGFTPDDPVYRLGELAAPTGIADLAMNIDHYLYGHPKAADGQP
jgi:hypothetical protein